MALKLVLMYNPAKRTLNKDQKNHCLENEPVWWTGYVRTNPVNTPINTKLWLSSQFPPTGKLSLSTLPYNPNVLNVIYLTLKFQLGVAASLRCIETVYNIFCISLMLYSLRILSHTV